MQIRSYTKARRAIAEADTFDALIDVVVAIRDAVRAERLPLTDPERRLLERAVRAGFNQTVGFMLPNNRGCHA